LLEEMHDTSMFLQTTFLNHEEQKGKDTKHTKTKEEHNDIKRRFLKGHKRIQLFVNH
jgi:hypothetical protein